MVLVKWGTPSWSKNNGEKGNFIDLYNIPFHIKGKCSVLLALYLEIDEI